MQTTVDYRWSPPPTTSFHFNATVRHGRLVFTMRYPELIVDQSAMMDVDDSDDESDESHFLAVYNLDAAVRGFRRDDESLLARRPSLSAIVVVSEPHCFERGTF